MFGFTSSVTFYAVAAAFNLGAYLIQNKLLGINFEDVMLAKFENIVQNEPVNLQKVSSYLAQLGPNIS